jgi:hypothetical protein
VRGEAVGTLGGIGVSATGPIGIVGESNAGYYAGVFYGPVAVSGSLTVYGAKSAAVRLQDGSHRRVYCVESPDSVFEDFGQGTLAAGRAQVRIDPEFAATVKTDDYAVFLTPEGECKGLFVTAKTPTGFEVRELQGGTSSLPFRYRIVAARKDVEVARMERLQLDLPKPPPPLAPVVKFDPPPGVSVPQPGTQPADPQPAPPGGTPVTRPTAVPSPRAT